MQARIWGMVLLVLFVAITSGAQEPTEAEQLEAWNNFLQSIEWVPAGEVGEMGSQASIDVPEGYAFTGPDGTQELMQAFGNLLSDQEVGFVAPLITEENPNFDWFAVFEFDEVGYVSDEEKADLDAEEMMETMLKSQKAANKQRREMGYDTLDITGWAMEPRYNERTHNLEWAIDLRSGDGSEATNLNTRLLGREGVMKVTLVCDPEALEATTPAYQKMLSDFQFQNGRQYAEFREGDKLAKYGLTGLVVGGGAAVLAKTGLLKKLFKPILIGLVAIGGWLSRVFSRKKGSV
ncbi:MAG: DUF2167 domain-containing protein [bacterium]|nr:DUF2167 domain-containing protein [bacterium]